MPLLSDYLNFNGVPGTQGPQGYQGEPSVSLIFQGHDTWTNIDLIASPGIGDAWELTDPAGAPDSSTGPAESGDWVVWNGTEWINIGQLEVAEGPQGAQGEKGASITPMGSDIWANISLITTMNENDLWILTDADPSAPDIGVAPGPVRAAMVGDGVVWNLIEWINIGPIQGPQGDIGAQGPQGFQGDVGTPSTVPGPQGSQGFQGDDGDPAQSIIFKGIDTWANISALVSPVQNEAWALTDADPTAPVSPYGPAAIGDIVIFDGTSAWINIGPILGPQGDVGAQGPQGFQGVASTVAGPQGTTGAQGSTGAQGAVGQTGAGGAQGPQGFAGSTGGVGPQGDKGDVGSQGFQGDTGAASTVPGPQGDDGLAGPRGFQGATGDDGPTGPRGFQGDDGSDGSDGGTGPQGPQGEEGASAPITGGTESLAITGVSESGTVTRTTVGNLVIIAGRLSWSTAGSGSSAVFISGFLFPCTYATGFVVASHNMNLGASPDAGRVFHARMASGSSALQIMKVGEDGDESACTPDNLNASGWMDINFSYYSNAVPT